MFSVNESIGYHLGMAAKKVRARFSQLMKEHGIDFGHGGWIVLSRLWEEDGLNQQEISDRSNVAKPNISNYLDKLEKDNYIVRITDPEDRRIYRVYLTNKGKDYKELCQKLAQQSNDELLKPLGKDEKDQFAHFLKKINGT